MGLKNPGQTRPALPGCQAFIRQPGRAGQVCKRAVEVEVAVVRRRGEAHEQAAKKEEKFCSDEAQLCENSGRKL